MIITPKLTVLVSIVSIYFACISFALEQSYFDKRTSILKHTKVTYRKKPKHSNVPDEYYDKPRPYKHNFKRLINEPDLCSRHERLLLLYIVRSFHTNFGRREILREIFQDIPHDPYSKNIIVRHVFIFGKTNYSTLESLIQNESNKYRDIIQEDFMESYTNVSLKTIMAWKWSVEFCGNADYVMVMNDELFVDQYKLVPHLQHQLLQSTRKDRFVACYRPEGPGNLKFFHEVKHVPQNILYKGKRFPRFCNGVGYVAHIFLINKLYIAALDNHVFMPDDAWNGLLAEKLNIELPYSNKFYEFYNPIQKFSSPDYASSLLMFLVIDKRSNRNDVEAIEEKLLTIFANRSAKNQGEILYIEHNTDEISYIRISFALEQSYFDKRTSILKHTKVTYRKKPKGSNVPDEYYDKPRPYKHNFKRLINEPDLCSRHERLLLLYIVRSFHTNFGRREILREIFQDIPHDPYSKNIIVRHVFIFGKTKNSTLESLIQNESNKYRDIIQEDFMESYTNVSLKTIMAWKWSVEFCGNADYVMVMNDELFVDQYKLVPYLQHQLLQSTRKDRFVACYRYEDSGDVKFFHEVKHVPQNILYKGKRFPRFCNGVGYVAHIFLINKLYIAALDNHVFMPDDAWNGLLAEKLNIELPYSNKFYEFYNPIQKFSSPDYESSVLMFAVTDKRSISFALEQSYFDKRTSILKHTKVTYRKKPKHSNVPDEYYDKPRPYKHNFKRLINEPDLCSRHERLLLLYIVRSFHTNFGRREILREIFQDIPHDPYSKNIIVRHVFIFGKTKNSTLESLIQNESNKYRDIIQEDFMESYTNVSLKTIMAWKWSVEFCGNADYVMVMNDELFVDQYKLVPHLQHQLLQSTRKDRFVACYRHEGPGNIKFFHEVKHVPQNILYKGKRFPRFCNGVGYVAHIFLINKLYIAALDNHVFMPDDAWNGLLAEKLNIEVPYLNKFYEFYNPIQKFSSPDYVSSVLMFAVTDKRSNRNHVEAIEEKLLTILANRRAKNQGEILYIEHNTDEIFYIRGNLSMSSFVAIKHISTPYPLQFTALDSLMDSTSTSSSAAPRIAVASHSVFTSGGISFALEQSYFDKRTSILKHTKVTYRKKPKHSNVPDEYYDKPRPYKHNFKRLINEPDLCSRHERLLLLYIVRSFHTNFGRREILRVIFQDIPHDPYSKNIIVRHVFIFGKTKNSTLESLIQNESNKYRDIIQEDFMESYTNVSLKTIMAWKWSVEFCGNADYVMVMNDELFVDQYKLVPYLHYQLLQSTRKDRFVACYRPEGPGNLKFFHEVKHVPQNILYKGKRFPRFCNGVGYVAHIFLINKLYIAALDNHVFMPDDAWNGLLSEKLNIELPYSNKFYEFYNPIQKFSSPDYASSLLMFLVIDKRSNRNDVEAIEEKLLTIFANRSAKNQGEILYIEHNTDEISYIRVWLIIIAIILCFVLYETRKYFRRFSIIYFKI
ncbi:beta-1,3-galactosyltransferase 1-like [Octopus vulgaris]|uniref:Beta-1,3-galactosyltransferase 1-like n=1 Tax=Octopus vulgaris TaxID=6645 RepID=A0AA36F6E2_OCTVU|nr:beta-1,3-galactosyltransferase 1-like [Octopus vulgaris]